jgi:predicted nucleic acid-binding protein
VGTSAQLILVDSDILIDASRQDYVAVDWLDRRRSEIAVSTITHIELLSGCRDKRDWQLTQGFLARFEHFTLTAEVSKLALQLFDSYRLSHGLMLADALIAATAIAWNVPLASKNQKDFRFIAELDLHLYPAT